MGFDKKRYMKIYNAHYRLVNAKYYADYRKKHPSVRLHPDSPEKRTYDAMCRRCRNPKNRSYRWYGARGIRVLYMSFGHFLLDVGPKPSAKHSIDRIDNDGNYEPGNCRWSTAAEQCHNKRMGNQYTC